MPDFLKCAKGDIHRLRLDASPLMIVVPVWVEAFSRRPYYAPMIGDEETTDPHYADDRNFYKVEVWTAHWLHVERLVYAGNRLDRPHAHFDTETRRHPA
jgi:hypothetical protein